MKIKFKMKDGKPSWEMHTENGSKMADITKDEVIEMLAFGKQEIDIREMPTTTFHKLTGNKVKCTEN